MDETITLNKAKILLQLKEPYTVDDMKIKIRQFCATSTISFTEKLAQYGLPPDPVAQPLLLIFEKCAKVSNAIQNDQLDMLTAVKLREIANLWADIGDYYDGPPPTYPNAQIARLLSDNNKKAFACYVVFQAYVNSRIDLQRLFRETQEGREGDPNALRF